MEEIARARALRAVQARDLFGVLVLDLEQPSGEGFELARQANELVAIEGTVEEARLEAGERRDVRGALKVVEHRGVLSRSCPRSVSVRRTECSRHLQCVHII